MMEDGSIHTNGARPHTRAQFLTRRVAVVSWRGYWFTVSQIRWGRLRRFLYKMIYHHSCPADDVKFETAVFLSHRNRQFNPQKPLHLSYQKNRREAKSALREITDQLVKGKMAFQSFFQR